MNDYNFNFIISISLYLIISHNNYAKVADHLLDFQISSEEGMVNFPGLLIRAAFPLLSNMPNVDGLILAESSTVDLENIAKLLVHGRYQYQQIIYFLL